MENMMEEFHKQESWVAESCGIVRHEKQAHRELQKKPE